MKNLLIKSSAAVFLAALFLFTNGIAATTHAEPVYAPDLQAGPEYDFRKAKWGMSAEEVKATENMVVSQEGLLDPDNPRVTVVIYLETGFSEVLSNLGYIFIDNELISGQYLFFQPVDAYQELIRICEKHYGPYDSVLQDKSDGAILLVWNLARTKISIRSYPTLNDNDDYEYKVEFSDAEAIDESFADPVSLEDYNPIFQAGPQYNFRKTRWLMTMDEVIASEDAAPVEEGLIDESGVKGKYLAYPKISVFGYPAMPGYTFIEDKLVIGSYFFDMPVSKENDLIAKCEAEFGPHKYFNVEDLDGEKQYTWDLGKSILTLNVPSQAGSKNDTCKLTFYYRKQLKEIPPK